MSRIARPGNTNRKMVPFYSIFEATGEKKCIFKVGGKSMERKTTKRKVFSFKNPQNMVHSTEKWVQQQKL